MEGRPHPFPYDAATQLPSLTESANVTAVEVLARTLSQERYLSGWGGETAASQHVLEFIDETDRSGVTLSHGFDRYSIGGPRPAIEARPDPGFTEEYVGGMNTTDSWPVEGIKWLGVHDGPTGFEGCG